MSASIMDHPAASRILCVRNPEGLHARAAMEVAKLLSRFEAKVHLIKGGSRVDGTDVLEILSLGAMQHQELTVEAFGEQAAEAIEALAALLESNFSDQSK